MFGLEPGTISKQLRKLHLKEVEKMNNQTQAKQKEENNNRRKKIKMAKQQRELVF